MKDLTKIITSNTGAVFAVGLVGAAVLYYAGKKADEAAGAVGDAINPVNHGNIFNRGFVAVTSAITGQENFQFGSWLAKKIHSND